MTLFAIGDSEAATDELLQLVDNDMLVEVLPEDVLYDILYDIEWYYGALYGLGDFLGSWDTDNVIKDIRELCIENDSLLKEIIPLFGDGNVEEALNKIKDAIDTSGHKKIIRILII